MPFNLEDQLTRSFGFASFKPGQQEAIETLLAGRNTLVVMPTGAGKSLVFQLLATMLEGITLVISPLIALMQDQVSVLNRRGIAATFINSAIPVAEQKRRLDDFRQAKFKILYIAPERLRSIDFVEVLVAQNVALLAIDEAHCISEWGHDFRPDYLHIAQARQSMGNPLTVALTATATPHVQADIASILNLGDRAARLVTGFNRPNLTLVVEYTNGVTAKIKRLRALLELDRRGPRIIYTGTRRDAEELADYISTVIGLPAVFYHAGLPAEDRTRIQNAFIAGDSDIIVATNAFGMGIDRADVRQVIHFSLPGSLEAYYQEAGRAGRDDIASRATLLYDPHDRALQEFFIESSAVTQADLLAIHQAIWRKSTADSRQAPTAPAQTATTPEAISELTGLHPVQIKVGISALENAGALQHLGDVGTRMHFRQGEWDAKRIETVMRDNQNHLRHRQAQLDKMIAYAEASSCRRQIILQHFGDASPANAQDCCDNCLARKVERPAASIIPAVEHTAQGPAGRTSGAESSLSHMDLDTRIALVILDCIHRLRTRLGKQKIAQILHGSRARDMGRYHYDRSLYYARLAAIRQHHIEGFIDQLADQGYIKTIGGKYPVLALTPCAEIALKDRQAIRLHLPKDVSREAIELKKEQLEAGGTVEYTAQLFNQGLSAQEIAEKRKLTSATIYGHLAHLVENGQVELQQILPAATQSQIEAAIARVGSTRQLTPIKALLPAEIDFGMIRCVIARQGFAARNDPAFMQNDAVVNQEIEDFLHKSRPRRLRGTWHSGWSLGFHSRFSGDEWSRSTVGDLTYRLKYQSDRSVLSELVGLALELLRSRPELMEVDAILPVPSTSNHSFDPVNAFCGALSEQIQVPVLPAIHKTRATRPQKEMKTLAQKQNNVAGAFAVQQDLRGRCTLLVDDLYDSGETLNEITRLLVRNGVNRVCVLTLTSTIHSDA